MQLINWSFNKGGNVGLSKEFEKCLETGVLVRLGKEGDKKIKRSHTLQLVVSSLNWMVQ